MKSFLTLVSFLAATLWISSCSDNKAGDTVSAGVPAPVTVLNFDTRNLTELQNGFIMRMERPSVLRRTLRVSGAIQSGNLVDPRYLNPNQSFCTLDGTAYTFNAYQYEDYYMRASLENSNVLRLVSSDQILSLRCQKNYDPRNPNPYAYPIWTAQDLQNILGDLVSLRSNP
jgi:hypothetical protein